MKLTSFVLVAVISFCQRSIAQSTDQLLTKSDLQFLEKMTRDVLDSSRIMPGQFISPSMGSNNTKGTLIRPGGRDAYPSFWIRDYAMSLETGYVTKAEQLHMLTLTASTQCDQSWITKGGSLVPLGAIADHIRIDNMLPIYFPGTYDYVDQGNKQYGMTPPYCDQYYFIHMAHYYFKTIGQVSFLIKEINGIRLIDRLETAFRVPPSRADNQLVFTDETFRGVDFGFRDAQVITGDLCYSSLLKYKAAVQLADLCNNLKSPAKANQYLAIASSIKKAIPIVFADDRGMLRASTGISKQPDVWATALAVYYKVLEGEQETKACKMLSSAYLKGDLAFKGNIRHILKSDDFNDQTAWESSMTAKNRYQNGAYWGTPTGWVCLAIAKVDRKQAQKLAKEFIDDLRENDFRKGGKSAAPYECFYPPAYAQNPLYLTTVACPLVAFRDGTPVD